MVVPMLAEVSPWHLRPAPGMHGYQHVTLRNSPEEATVVRLTENSKYCWINPRDAVTMYHSSLI